MPTPVGHVLGGMICLSFRKNKIRSDWLFILLMLLFAELPDIDLLFGLLEGNPNKYHHHFTHSFVFILAAGFVGGLIVKKLKVMQFAKSFVLFTVAGLSHLLLDLAALDTSAPFGAPIFWPFSQKYFIFPFAIFADVHRSFSSNTFWASLISRHNFETVLIEILVLMPILAVIYILRKKIETDAK